MAGSYEKEIINDFDKDKGLPSKLDIGIVKYFWQSNPIFGKDKNNIPKFLKTLDVLQNFSENELRILSRSLHARQFERGEIIFKQNDIGFGFYFILSGYVDIIVEPSQNVIDSENKEELRHILTLVRGDYVGELALLKNNTIRTASAIARESSMLLGIFKPDMDELIVNHPIVATKLIQSISLVIANRLFSLTKEVRSLKYKISMLEKERNE